MRLDPRPTAGLGALLLAGAGLVGLASPASAAQVNVTVTCTSGTVILTPSSVTVSPGDTIQLTNNSGGQVIAAGNAATPNPLSIASPSGTTGTLTVVQSGFVPVNVMNGPCTSGSYIFAPLTLTSGGSSTGSSSAPNPVVQEFGKPESGTCDTAQPEGLNWAGVTSGGWGESWAQWMNDGQGGFVCTRMLVYSTDRAAWVVN